MESPGYEQVPIPHTPSPQAEVTKVPEGSTKASASDVSEKFPCENCDKTYRMEELVL